MLNDRRDKLVAIMMEPEFKKRLILKAKDKGLNLSSLIRMVMTAYLKTDGA